MQIRVASPVSAVTESVDTLYPIWVAGGGRTGTTLLMQLLGTDSRCVFDTTYPLEGNYLTYLAYFMELFNGRDMIQMCDSPGGFHNDLQQFPVFQPKRNEATFLMPVPNTRHMLTGLWREFSKAVLAQRPHARFYAEKCSAWVPPLLDGALQALTVYSIRDPRDTFLSTNAWNNRHKVHGFHRTPTDTNVDHALKIASMYLTAVCNYEVNSESGTSLAVRYEDLVSDPLRALQPVSRATGLNFNPAEIDRFYDVHRTTKDKGSSVARWQKEPLDPELVNVFETNFGPELSFFGYHVDQKLPVSDVVVSFTGPNDLDQIVGVRGGDLGSFTRKGVQLGVLESEMTLTIRPRTVLRNTDEIWVCIAGDFADEYRLSWTAEDGTTSPGFVEAKRVPGDHHRILRFSIAGRNEVPIDVRQMELQFRRCGEQTLPSRFGWLKWVRRVSVPHQQASGGAPVPPSDLVSYSEHDIVLQQSAHIGVLTSEFERLTDLVDKLQKHIVHLETERDSYKSRWTRLSSLLSRAKSLFS